ncbi:MAG: PQQ-binding-like beta-propeller repeat protein, partial [Planctomycetota bacterium]
LRDALQQRGLRRQTQAHSVRLVVDAGRAMLALDDADHLLLYDHADAALAVYRGDGSDDPPLAARDGLALLGGPLLRCLDLQTGKLRWEATAPDGRSVDWAAFLGDGVIAATEHSLFLVDAISGRLQAQVEHWPGGSVVGVQSGIVVGYQQNLLRGFGATERLMQDLQERIATAPEDHRPLLAMAALLEAQRRPLQAYAHLAEALQRGAPLQTVDRALAMLRPELRLRIGTDQAAPVLQALTDLAAVVPAVRYEQTWWQAQHAALLDQTGLAERLWRSIPPQLDYSIDGALGSLVQIGFSAAIQQARTAGEAGPLRDAIQMPAPVRISQAGWRRDYRGHGNLLRQGQRWYWYCEGLLQGIALGDGSSVWRQRTHDDDRPMLGLYLNNPRPGQTGVPVDVIPGSSAYRAGIRDADLLLRIGKRNVVTGRDVQARVAEMDIGGDFQATVLREGTELELDGRLGSWPEEPVAANERFLVTRSMLISRNRDGDFEATPDTDRNPVLRVYRIADGQLHWSRTISVRQKAYAPLLTDADLLLLADNNGLQAWDLGQAAARLRWEEPGQGYELERIRQIGPDHVLVSDTEHERLLIRSLRDGCIAFSCSWHPSFPAVLDDHQLLVTDPDRQLHLLDLATGRSLWQGAEAGLDPVAVTQQYVYTIDREQRLASWHRRNGLPHRRYNQWQRVLDLQVRAERAYYYVVSAEGDKVIGALDLGAGITRWEHVLPEPLELLGELVLGTTGVTAHCADGHQGRVVLRFAADGAIASVQTLEQGEHALHAGDEDFAVSPDHLRHLPTAAPGSPGSLPGQVVGSIDLDGWRSALLSAVDGRPTHPTPGGRVNGIVADTVLALAIAPVAEQRGVTLRVDRGSGALVTGAGLVLWRPGQEPAQVEGDGSWSLLDHHMHEDGRLLVLLAAHATAEQLPWYIHLAPVTAEGTPWWLRSNWWRLRAAPPGSGGS